MSYTSLFTLPNKNREDFVDAQMYAYRTSLPAQLRATSSCSGPGPAAGMLCATTGLRRTIAGDSPVLHHRSYISAGGPITPFENFPDTLGVSVPLTEAQKLALNRGTSMLSYDARLLGTNDIIRENTGQFARAMSHPNTWRESFTFMPSVGTNQSSRLEARNLASLKDSYFRGRTGSYGSYGVVVV